MVVLLGCEESQEVCLSFRDLGHDAYSCDLIPTSGLHPEWHLQMDVFAAIEWMIAKYGKIDLFIAFPPCTYLTVTGNKWLKDQPKRKSGKLVGEERRKAQKEAIEFFMRLTRTSIKRWAIENPVGIMSKEYRQPNQIIHPYYFGHEEAKKTCLWLHNLPRLNGSLERADLKFEPAYMELKSGKRMPEWYARPKHTDERQTMRSKTFRGIAKAMAEQWGRIKVN